jgi:uncharacterized protein YgiM (DUF1202 family)
MYYMYCIVCVCVCGVKDKNVNSKCTQTNDLTVTYKGQTRPLVREGAPQRQDKRFQTQTLEKERYLVKRPQSGLDNKKY